MALADNVGRGSRTAGAPPVGTRRGRGPRPDLSVDLACRLRDRNGPEQVVLRTERNAAQAQLVSGPGGKQRGGDVGEATIRTQALEVEKLIATASAQVNQHDVGPPSSRMRGGLA